MTFIIAEVGSNWSEYRDIKDSCVAAAKAGASAVKFQCFSEASLYGNGDSHPNLPYEWIPKIRDLCNGLAIEFMCSAFDEETLLYINKFVKRHKLASSEMCHAGLIDKLKHFEKPVIVSVGGHTMDEIQDTVTALKPCKTTLLYCNNAYPSRFHDLRFIEKLRGGFRGVDVGFSDHTIDLFTSYAAVKHYDAKVIEKHVRLDRITGGPDCEHSLTFGEFELLVKRIKGSISNVEHPARDEGDARLMHNRRLVVTQSVNVGDALQYGRNFGIFRSRVRDEIGLPPSRYKDVDGTRAASGLSAGDPIAAGDFK